MGSNPTLSATSRSAPCDGQGGIQALRGCAASGANPCFLYSNLAPAGATSRSAPCDGQGGIQALRGCAASGANPCFLYSNLAPGGATSRFAPCDGQGGIQALRGCAASGANPCFLYSNLAPAAPHLAPLHVTDRVGFRRSAASPLRARIPASFTRTLPPAAGHLDALDALRGGRCRRSAEPLPAALVAPSSGHAGFRWCFPMLKRGGLLRRTVADDPCLPARTVGDREEAAADEHRLIGVRSPLRSPHRDRGPGSGAGRVRTACCPRGWAGSRRSRSAPARARAPAGRPG